ncbi:MAG: AAA family ATPase, partial [Atopobiaceae bacterium]|nr:AAA family ATPase [Atopobiaceae bacterium]
MARTVSIGTQSFENIRTNNLFYVDKTSFISEWWNAYDDVTLICRPRRFGKTLNLDTVRCFFSTEFEARGEELFGGLEVWQDP